MRLLVILKRPLTKGLAKLAVLMAAIILTLAPSIDAAAFAARNSDGAGIGSQFQQVLSACDIVEDSLDHLPDRNRAPASHQISLVALPCDEQAPLARMAITRLHWNASLNDVRYFGLISETFRPPQA